MLRNSAADTFHGGFTASKIRRLIRRAVIFSGGGFSADKKYSAANSAIGGGGWGVYLADLSWARTP